MAKIKVDGYKCGRCGHIWLPREYIKKEPSVCPKCKSPYWNKNRKLVDRHVLKPGKVITLKQLVNGTY